MTYLETGEAAKGNENGGTERGTDVSQASAFALLILQFLVGRWDWHTPILLSNLWRRKQRDMRVDLSAETKLAQHVHLSTLQSHSIKSHNIQ
jgi:hypothetical protein